MSRAAAPGLYLALARAAVAADLPQACEYAVIHLNALAALVKQYPGDADLQYGLSIAHIELGWVLIHLGNPETAAGHYENSMRLREQLVQQHPADALYRRSLMLAYEHFGAVQGGTLMPNLGKPEKARAYYRKAQPLEEASAADPQNSQAAADYAWFLLKFAALETGRDGLAESLAMLRRAAAILESLAPHGYDLKIAATYIYIGHRLAAMGRGLEAIRQYERAVALADTSLSAHPADWRMFQQRLDAEAGIIRTLTLAADHSGALKHAERLMAEAEQGALLGSGSGFRGSAFRGAWIAQAQLALAMMHRALHEWEAAGEAAREALLLARGGHGGRVRRTAASSGEEGSPSGGLAMVG